MASSSNISRGIGHGEAQVYNSSSPINTFARILAQQKAEREREVNEIQTYLGSAKTDGLRDADRDDYFNKYDKWRESTVKAYKARGGLERARGKADADRELSELNRFVAESKAYNKLHQDVSVKALDNDFRDQFDDAGWNEWMASSKRALSDYKTVRDPSTIGRVVDMSKVMEKFDKIDDQIMQNHAKYDAKVPVNDGKGFITSQNIKRGDPAKQHEYYMNLVTIDKPTKLFIKEQYKDLFATMPEQEAMSLATKDYAEKRSLVRPEKDDRDRDPDYISPEDQIKINQANQRLSLQERRLSRLESGGSGLSDSTYRQKVVDGVLNNNKASIDEMKAYLPANSTIEYKTSFKTADSKGGYNTIRIDIPAVVDAATGTIKRMAIKEDISLSKGDAMNRINAILNEYTGEKISPSKLNIEGGKPRGEQIKIKGKEKSGTQATSSQPKKGDTMQVKEGTAVYNGTKWVMK